MAIDSAAKRIASGQGGMPFEAGIFPDGTISAVDRIASIWEYSGIIPFAIELIYNIRVLTEQYKMTSIGQQYNFQLLNEQYQMTLETQQYNFRILIEQYKLVSRNDNL